MRRIRFETPQGNMTGLEFGNPADRLASLWLHATGFNAMTYQSIMGPLGLRTRVQAVDLRGHGRTTLPAVPRKLKSWKRHRDDIIAYLDREAPIRPVVLGGHSMGATVALLVAGARPEKVAGLVLVDPVILPPSAYRAMHLFPLLAPKPSISKRVRKRQNDFPSMAAIFDALKGHGAFKTWREPFLGDYVIDAFDRVDENDPDSEDQIWRLLCDPKYEAANYRAHRNRPWGALAKVRKHKIPITVLRPQHDSILTDKVAARLMRKCPHLLLKERANTTHFLPMEAPYDVRDALSEIIADRIEGFSDHEHGPVKRTLRS